MPDLQPDERLAPAEPPEHWAKRQLEWGDSQLSNYTPKRARHRADVQLYSRAGAAMPLRCHQAQVDQCTARITELLDLRLRVMHRAGVKVQQ